MTLFRMIRKIHVLLPITMYVNLGLGTVTRQYSCKPHEVPPLITSHHN
jgi:hypothetical protein